MTRRPRVLIAGVSARAVAASAVRAGYAVTTLDAFADRDLTDGVRALSLPRDCGVPFSARAAARVAGTVDADAVVYLSSFENHPSAVRALAAGRALWGNPPDVLTRVRNPRCLLDACRRRGIPAPSVLAANDPNGSPNGPNDPNDPNDPNEWLLKPRASGGGRGIRPWDGRRVPRGFYVQRRLDGIPASVVFVAAGGRAVPLAVSRQLIGEPAFGAGGFRYCGNIIAASGDGQFAEDDRVVRAACEVAEACAGAFGLVGVNGVDFIARAGVACPVEVNPRWSGSVDLAERAYGLSMFEAHASACVSGALPRFDLAQARRAPGAVGKAIVFAREDATIGSTDAWLADDSVHDVPHAGERIASGRPVCTVYAAGTDAAACYAALVAGANRVYAELAAWSG